jgi:hypothetical protein
LNEWKQGITVKHHLRNHRERRAGKNTSYQGETRKERREKEEAKEHALQRWQGAKDVGPLYFGTVIGKKRVEELRHEETNRAKIEEERSILQTQRARADMLARGAAEGSSKGERALLAAVREMNAAAGKAWQGGDLGTPSGGGGWRARAAAQRNKPKSFKQIALEMGAVREAKAARNQIERKRLQRERMKKEHAKAMARPSAIAGRPVWKTAGVIQAGGKPEDRMGFGTALAAVEMADSDMSSVPGADANLAPRTAGVTKYLRQGKGAATMPGKQGVPPVFSATTGGSTHGAEVGFSTYSSKGAMINMRLLSASGRYNLQRRLVLATEKCEDGIKGLRKAHEFQPDFISDEESQNQEALIRFKLELANLHVVMKEMGDMDEHGEWAPRVVISLDPYSHLLLYAPFCTWILTTRQLRYGQGRHGALKVRTLAVLLASATAESNAESRSEKPDQESTDQPTFRQHPPPHHY